MKNERESKITDYWKQYLPLKYVDNFKVKPPPLIGRTVKSSLHQTTKYIVEPFYKVTSKIDTK